MTPSQQQGLTVELLAELTGNAFIPIIAAMIVGGYRLYADGLQVAGFPHGYALIVGGILSIGLIAAYGKLIYEAQGPSWKNGATAFGGLVPYAYSIYVMGFVGVMPLIGLFTDRFSWSGLFLGLFGLTIGHRTLFSFWILTEFTSFAQSKGGPSEAAALPDQTGGPRNDIEPPKAAGKATHSRPTGVKIGLILLIACVWSASALVSKGRAQDSTALPPELVKMMVPVYLAKLDAWVNDGSKINEITDRVLKPCGEMIIATASAKDQVSFTTTKGGREEFDVRVDVCVKLTVQRTMPQPVFENPTLVRFACRDMAQLHPVFKDLCARARLSY